MNDTADSGGFLRGLPFFAGLPEDVLHALVSRAKHARYHKHDIIFRQADAAARFFAVESGWVKLYRHTREGEEAVVALFTRGDVFGEDAIFGSAVYPFSAAAAEDCTLVELTGDDLRAQAKACHGVMARIMNSLSRELRNLQMENEHLALMSAPQRVGCLLLQLSAQVKGEGGEFSFPYDKSLAAARLGMKPETFSRALAQLRPVGVTVEDDNVSVSSFSTLVEYCCAHCSALPGECKGSRDGHPCDRAATCPGTRIVQITEK